MSPAPESVAFDRDEPFPLPVERRYPLDLSIRIPELRRLYHESNAAIWDVARELDVDAIDTSSLDPGTARAAALSWSRRAWLAFADISESEAALVRACLEPDREADVKFVLAARGTERAVAADAAHQIASRFGGYRAAPPGEMADLYSGEPIRRALDARVDFDAFFVAHFVVLATIERALLEAAVADTTDPVCRAALERMLVDVRRQEGAGRIYVRARLEHLDDDVRGRIGANVAEVIALDVHSGRRCPAFVDPAVPGASEMLEAETATARGGLGATAPADQREIVTATLTDLGRELGDVGLVVPTPTDPNLTRPMT